MNLHNPLPDTWEAVQAARDAFEITNRMVLQPTSSHPTLQKIQHELRHQTVYEVGKSLSSLPLLDRKKKFKELEKEIHGLLVLDLWATFEHFLGEYLLEVLKPQSQPGQPVPFAELLKYKRRCDDLQRWKMGDILDFLKESSSDPRMPKLIGDAKNIMMYRNWVAHADPRKTTRTPTDLELTYKNLNELIEILLQTG